MGYIELENGVLLLGGQKNAGAENRALQRAASTGALVRVRHGAYALKAWWDEQTPREQHVWRVRLFEHLHPGTVFTHSSAAAILDLPILGAWGTLVHARSMHVDGGASSGSVRRHVVNCRPEDITQTDGILHTTAARTAADVAGTSRFRAAVITADAVLRRSPQPSEVKADIESQWSGKYRGRAVRRVFAFASELAESPGESLSRATIEELGFPAPSLQAEFRSRGRTFRTDFAWPEYGLIGEFDGVDKYLRHAPAAGLSIAEAIIAEKRREDDVRALSGAAFARWGWDDALRPERLEAVLVRAGLPVLRSRNRHFAA